MIKKIYSLMTAEKISAYEAFQRCGVQKERLALEMENGDISATVLLLLGFSDNIIDTEEVDFVDEETGEPIRVPCKKALKEHIFTSNPDEVLRIEGILSSGVKNQTDDTLLMWRRLFKRNIIPLPIVAELADRGNIEALEWMGDYFGGCFRKDDSFQIDKDNAVLYFKKALDAGLGKREYAYDITRIEHGLKWDDRIDWVYGDEAFLYTLGHRHDNPEQELSVADYYEEILNQYWFHLFPSPMAKSMYNWTPENCTLKDLADKLISNGTPESAFHVYHQGVLVDFKNLSFYLVTGPEDENQVPDGVLAIGPHYRKIDPNQGFHFFMFEESFPAESFIECMTELDKRYPEIITAIDMVEDKLVGEKEDREKKLPRVISVLKRIFGEEYPNKINSVDYYYSYGPNLSKDHQHYLDYNFYKEMVLIEFMDGSISREHDLNISYYDFMRLPEDFFIWYSDNPGIMWFDLSAEDSKEQRDDTRIISFYHHDFVEFKAQLSDLTYTLLEQKEVE